MCVRMNYKIWLFFLYVINVFATEQVQIIPLENRHKTIIKNFDSNKELEENVKKISHFVEERSTSRSDYRNFLYDYILKLCYQIKDNAQEIKKSQEIYSQKLSQLIHYMSGEYNIISSMEVKRDTCSFFDIKKMIQKLYEYEEELKNKESIYQEHKNARKQIETIVKNTKKIEKMEDKKRDEALFQKAKNKKDKNLVDFIIELQKKLIYILDYHSELQLCDKDLDIIHTAYELDKFKKRYDDLKAQYKKCVIRFYMSKRQLEAVCNQLHQEEEKLIFSMQEVNNLAEEDILFINRYKDELNYKDISVYDFLFILIEKITTEKNIFQKIHYIDLLLAIIDHAINYLSHDFDLEELQTRVKIIQKNINITEAWAIIGNQESTEKDFKNISIILENDLLNQDLELVFKKHEDLVKKMDLIFEQMMKLDYDLNLLLKRDNSLKDSLDYLFKKIGELKETCSVKKEKFHKQYTYIGSIYNGIQVQIRQLIIELQEKNFWNRSKYSIGEGQLKQFFPDLKSYFVQLTSDFKPFMKNVKQMIINKKLISQERIMILLVILIFAFLLGLLGYFFIPYIYRILLNFSQSSPFWARFTLFFSFFMDQWLLYPWFIMFIFFKYEIIYSAYLSQLFYLSSIGYLYYVVYNFFNWFFEIDKSRGFIFIRSENTEKIRILSSIVAYVSIFIYFFRIAFFKSPFVNSAVPTVLLAGYFILLQIVLISFLNKQQIISMIQGEGSFKNLLRYAIDKYYALFFVAFLIIIIMSNPYVGYGKQVFYIISRLIFTVILIPFFLQAYDFLKKIAASLFFYYTEQDTIQNRIAGGRSWYAFSIICLFFAMFLGFYIFIGKIWNLDISYESIKYYLNYNFIDSYSVSDKVSTFSLAMLFNVFVFIVLGYVTTYIFNNLILQRILDPLMVGVGLQNTATTLSKYILVVIFFLLGLHNSGLDSLTTKIAVVLGAIGFAVKEPFADFISYFIILVQRPIKIGDFIRIYNALGSEEIVGIVRQITPRATLIRQNNSHIIIVPNSLILTRAVINWNFVKGFVSIEDIFLNIEFKEDPEYIKQLLIKIVEQHPLLLKNPSPIIRCRDFTASGYQFLVRAYIPSDRAIDLFEISSQVRILIAKKLAEQNIQLSKPHYILENIEKKTKE
jgi:small-conductance mechanosensitive channel